MISKAVQLELLKFKGYKPFWIITGLFIAIYFTVGFSIKSIVDFFLRENAFEGFLSTGLPLFDFVDIWQNLGYITFLFKFILAFVVIISVCMEYSNKTIRQNMIDGLSHREYLTSKISLVVFLSVLAGVLLLLLGLALGFLYSPVKSIPFIVMNIEFVAAYMLEVFAFLTFAMFFGVLIKRTGFAIILFVLYAIALEPIAAALMQYEYEVANWYLPIRSINNLISVPFPKYIFREVQDFVALKDVLVTIVWTGIWIILSYRLLIRRDT